MPTGAISKEVFAYLWCVSNAMFTVNYRLLFFLSIELAVIHIFLMMLMRIFELGLQQFYYNYDCIFRASMKIDDFGVLSLKTLKVAKSD